MVEIVTCKCGVDYYKVNQDFIDLIASSGELIEYIKFYWPARHNLWAYQHTEDGTWLCNIENDRCDQKNCPTHKDRV